MSGAKQRTCTMKATIEAVEHIVIEVPSGTVFRVTEEENRQGESYFDCIGSVHPEVLARFLESVGPAKPKAVPEIASKGTRVAERLEKCAVVVGYDIEDGDAYVIKEPSGKTGRVEFEHAIDRMKLAKLAADVEYAADQQDELDE